MSASTARPDQGAVVSGLEGRYALAAVFERV